MHTQQEMGAGLRASAEAQARNILARSFAEAERAREAAAAERLKDQIPAKHRAELEAAIAARKPFAAAAAKARADLTRAEQFIAGHKASTREREEVAAARAREYAAQLVRAGERGENAELTENPKLMAKAEAIDAAEANFEAARAQLPKLKAGFGVLADGSTEADRRLAEIDLRISKAAAAVANDEAEFLLEVLKNIQAEAFFIADHLLGFARMNFNMSKADIFGLRDPDGMSQILARILRPSTYPSDHPARAYPQIWGKHFEDLKSDANATYSTEEHK